MHFLKWVFAKNERWYGLPSILIFDGDCFKAYFYNVCCVCRRKLLKMTHTKGLSVHTNSESCNIWLGSLKNQFSSEQIINISLTTCFHSWHWIFEHYWKIWKCRLHYQKPGNRNEYFQVFKNNPRIIKYKNQVSSNHHRIFFDVSLYPLSSFANTPFKNSDDYNFIHL